MRHRPVEETNDKIYIREMRIEDVDQVVRIAATDPYNPWTKAMFLGELLTPPSSHGFLLCQCHHDEEDSAVGFICFRVLGEESELLNIGIAPEHRQRGFGKRLMEFYLDFCHQRGVKKYYLEVHPENLPALHLYRSFHYRGMGRRKRFYQGVDALVLER